MPARAVFILYLSCIVAIFPFLIVNLLLNKSLLASNVRSFVVSSGSMEPVVSKGSIIYTAKKQQYHIGDIITFLVGEETISHRIVGYVRLGTQMYYSTKGDANNVRDFDLVPVQNVYGKIQTAVPLIGFIILLFKTPIGLTIGTVLPTLLFVFAKLPTYSIG